MQNDEAPVLMPEPNHYRFRRGLLRLADGDAVHADPPVRAILADLTQRSAQALGISFQETADPAAARVRFTLLDDARPTEELALPGDAGRQALARPESYSLAVGTEHVTAQARDARGFQHALQTLRQLVVLRPRPGLCLARNAAVLDYPHLGIRGVHLYLPARQDIPYFRRLVEGLALLKYNRIYLEVSGMEYRRHPEIDEAWREYCRDMNEFPEKAKIYQSSFHRGGTPWYKTSIHIENAGGDVLTQEEVRELVAWCRRRLIEVVPEVQSLSHCEYLVVPHREIAEIPQDPYPSAYCPSNPRAYELLFDVIDEVIDVFQPDLVNIGHDEWYTPCICPACRGRDAAELLAEDVRKIRDYLAGRGIEVEMWADKLLDAHTPDGRGQGGALRIVENYETSEVYTTMPATWRAVDLIPKDVRLGHWYWRLEPGAFDWYASHGLTQAVFNNLWGPALRDWETHSRNPIVKGGVLSHWDSTEEQNMAREGTLTNIVYSSFPLWNECYGNASWPRVRDLTFRFMPVFQGLLSGQQPPGASSAPRDIVTFPVRHEKRDRLYMDASVIELRCHSDPVLSHHRTEGYGRDARVVEGMKAQSFRVACVNDRVDSLVFRHATTFHAPFRSADHGYRLSDYHVGFYTVVYAGGKTAMIDLSYGSTIGPTDAGWGRTESACVYAESIELMQVAYRTRPRVKTLNASDAVTVYDYEWANPAPGEEIRSISLTLAEKKEPYSVFVYDIVGVRLRREPGTERDGTP